MGFQSSERAGARGGRIQKLSMAGGVLLLILFSLFTVGVMAQEVYPSKKVTFICASSPGGGMDLTARSVAPFLGKYLKDLNPGLKGGDVEVKNMPGASHAKAISYVFKEARPDGYTIGDFIRGNVYKFSYSDAKLPFDVTELTWLWALGETQRVLICNKKRFSTWEEMVAAAKKEPLTFECSSVGSSEQLDTIFLKEIAGIPGKLTFSGGSAETIGSLIRGDTDISLIEYTASKALVESKEVNVLVTVTPKRIIPDVPTIAEKGFPDVLKYVGGECSGRMIMAPPKLAPEAKTKLLAALRKTFDDPEFKALLAKIGTTNDVWLDDQVRAHILEHRGLLFKMAPTLKKYGL